MSKVFAAVKEASPGLSGACLRARYPRTVAIAEALDAHFADTIVAVRYSLSYHRYSTGETIKEWLAVTFKDDKWVLRMRDQKNPIIFWFYQGESDDGGDDFRCVHWTGDWRAFFADDNVAARERSSHMGRFRVSPTDDVAVSLQARLWIVDAVERYGGGLHRDQGKLMCWTQETDPNRVARKEIKRSRRLRAELPRHRSPAGIPCGPMFVLFSEWSSPAYGLPWQQRAIDPSIDRWQQWLAHRLLNRNGRPAWELLSARLLSSAPIADELLPAGDDYLLDEIGRGCFTMPELARMRRVAQGTTLMTDLDHETSYSLRAMAHPDLNDRQYVAWLTTKITYDLEYRFTSVELIRMQHIVWESAGFSDTDRALKARVGYLSTPVNANRDVFAFWKCPTGGGRPGTLTERHERATPYHWDD